MYMCVVYINFALFYDLIIDIGILPTMWCLCLFVILLINLTLMMWMLLYNDATDLLS